MGKITHKFEFTDKEIEMLTEALDLYGESKCEEYQDCCENEREFNKFLKQLHKLSEKFDEFRPKDESDDYSQFEIPEEEMPNTVNTLNGILSSMGIEGI